MEKVHDEEIKSFDMKQRLKIMSMGKQTLDAI